MWAAGSWSPVEKSLRSIVHCTLEIAVAGRYSVDLEDPMPENTTLGIVLSASLHIAAGWTMLSFATAALWCAYRSPGRSQRLALESARDLAD